MKKLILLSALFLCVNSFAQGVGAKVKITAGAGITSTVVGNSYTLAATGGGTATTVITASTNITLAGSSPSYTISAKSPTITAGANTSVTTSGLSYTIATTPSLSTSGPSLTISNGNTILLPGISGFASRVPFYGSPTATLTNHNKFKWDSTNYVLTVGLSTIGRKTIAGIDHNLEFQSGSSIGAYSFRPITTNLAARLYIMPNGSPTGTTAKFEIFDTDYSSGSANYRGFNIFTNNTQSTIWIGGNVAGSASRMKMVIAGKFNASVVDAGSNRIDFETDETITINSTGGGVGVGGSAVSGAKLAVISTTAGFLPPKLNVTQAGALSPLVEGILIYVTNTDGTFTAKGWWGYDGAAWQKLNN